MVRERITVSGGNRVVSGAAVRLAKTSGTGNLVVRLEDGSGTLIDSFSVPTSSVPVIDPGPPVGPVGVRLVLVAPHAHQRRDVQPAPVDRLFHVDVDAGHPAGRMYGFHQATYFADGLLEVPPTAAPPGPKVPGLGKTATSSSTYAEPHAQPALHLNAPRPLQTGRNRCKLARRDPGAAITQATGFHGHGIRRYGRR